MSNFLDGMRGEMTTEPESQLAQKALHAKHLATELGKNTDLVVAAMSEDQNEPLYNVLFFVKSCGFKISMTQAKESQDLDAQFIDDDNNLKGSITIEKFQPKAEDNHSKFKVQPKTFQKLESLIVDRSVAEADIDSKLQHSI